MRTFLSLIFFSFFSNNLYADDSSIWLKKEIDIILDSYKNENISNEERFLLIENTINYNFAGAGIAKFVSGESWSYANKEIKKKYIKIFKKHLAINIASMMQGYSDQEYSLINNSYDSKNKVSLIDMEIFTDTGSLVITWRVKSSKDRFFIIDLLVANISLVVTKRSEFNSMLKNVDNNLGELTILLDQQNDEGYKKLINS